MEILVIGLNHKTAPVELREKLAVPTGKASDFLESLKRENIFTEQVLLSTCNRTEVYGVTDNAQESVDKLKDFLSNTTSLNRELFEEKLYVLPQPHSIRHLFSVASGLDSMVLGETEILGQVKKAYLFSHKIKQTGKVLNALFQRSLKVAKNIRTHTSIGIGKVSVASVAVDLAEKIFETLHKTKVLVLGTGDASVQVLKTIVDKGATPLIVSSRHFERAQKLAEDLRGEAVRYEDYEKKLDSVDILIAATTAPNTLIRNEHVRSWMKARRQKPLFLIDIAVPRNIDTAVEKMDNVYLYNIDDLQKIAITNKAARENQLSQCLEITGRQTQLYMDWLEKEFSDKVGEEAKSLAFP